MSERLIIDVGMPKNRDYAALLGLPGTAEVVRLTSARAVDCEGVDRAVFVPNLTQGGPYPYQMEQIDRARAVGRWVVYAEDADPTVIRQFRLRLDDSVALFTDAEAARAALSGRAPMRDSCLVLGLTPDAPAEAVAALLKRFLPYWHVSAGTLERYGSVDAALDAMPSARLALLACRPADFDGVAWPADVQPALLLERPGADEAERRALAKRVRTYLPEARESQIVCLDAGCERWRREVASGERDPLTLANEPAFCMRDAYGLPAAPEAYRDASAIKAYLDQFDGLEALAGRMG